MSKETPNSYREAMAAFDELDKVQSEAEYGLPADVYAFSDRLNAAYEAANVYGRDLAGARVAATAEERETLAERAATLFPKYVWRFSQILDRVNRNDRTSQRVADAALAEVARIAESDLGIYDNAASSAVTGYDSPNRDSRKAVRASLEEVAETCRKHNNTRRRRDRVGTPA